MKTRHFGCVLTIMVSRKLMLLNIVRRLHTSNVSWATETSVLAKLRKKTGYTISNCKKALEMHENDLTKAEVWLHAKAQEMGWSKATKLAGRATAQGLVAVKFDKSRGAVIEINCETDFVAKNEKFLSMMEEAANACYQFANTNLKTQGPITKLLLDTERLGLLTTSDGKNLKDKLALLIGTVGENATLKRAECWKANNEDVIITGYTHPNTSNDPLANFGAGKYGALLAFKIEDVQNEYVGKEICQHVVGMNPTKIGNANVDKPSSSENESCLIYQEFLLDSDVIVKDVLQENGLEIVDYIRFECGQENVPQVPEGHCQQALDNVQTCQ